MEALQVEWHGARRVARHQFHRDSAFSLEAPLSAEEVLYEQKLEPQLIPILVPVSIAGNNYTFIFDSGATYDFLDPALNRFLGRFKEGTSVQASGGSGWI